MKKDTVEIASAEVGCSLKEGNLSRRDVLRGAMAVGIGLLAPGVLLGSSSAAEVSVVGTAKKLSQADVKYQKMPKDQQKCADCVHFMAPNFCNLVEGTISPDGWCVLWAKKT